MKFLKGKELFEVFLRLVVWRIIWPDLQGRQLLFDGRALGMRSGPGVIRATRHLPWCRGCFRTLLKLVTIHHWCPCTVPDDKWLCSFCVQTSEQAFKHIQNIVEFSKNVMKPLLGETCVHHGVRISCGVAKTEQHVTWKLSPWHRITPLQLNWKRVLFAMLCCHRTFRQVISTVWRGALFLGLLNCTFASLSHWDPKPAGWKIFHHW